MIISLYKDASQIINFMNYEVLRFEPGTPELRDERVANVAWHGEDILFAKYKNAIATLEIMILATSVNNVDNLVEVMEKSLEDIMAVRGTGSETRYLVFQPNGSSDTWRSEVYTCRIIQRDQRAQENYEKVFKGGDAVNRFFRRLTLVFERAPFWDDLTETELSLSNGHGSGTGGIEVRNTNDTADDNYVQIAGTSIEGSERTPLVIQFEHNDTTYSTSGLRNVSIARNGRFNPFAVYMNYEVEDADYLGGWSYSTDTNAIYSEGEAIRWSPVGTTEGTLAIVQLIPGTTVRDYRGRWFHVLVNVRNITMNVCRLKAKLVFANATLMDAGWVEVTTEGIQDLGALRIPPEYFGDVTHDSSDLHIEMYDPNGDAGAISLDCIYMMPSEPQDGFMVVEAQGYEARKNWGFFADGQRRQIRGFTNIDWSISYFSKRGNFIEAEPGQDMRLIFAWDIYTVGAVPVMADTRFKATVRAWYRRRRVDV